MVDFLNLIRNENMKMFRAPRLFVMLGIVLALVIAISSVWFTVDKGQTAMWEVIITETMFLYWIVTIFAVIVASGTVAEEFSTGTIKLLLIRPWNRSKILLSKYISSLLFALFFAIVFLASLLLVNWIFFDLLGNGESVERLSQFTSMSNSEYMFKYYGLLFLNTVMTVTISFMLSTVFRSSVLAIAMALFIEIVVNNLMQLLAFVKYKWIDYVLFVHLDLTKFVGGNVASDGKTLGFSLSVLGVYYVIFIALTWIIFNKRDVAS
ncbi:ABC transporter permease [Paenibacillus paeoniae]|uniref:ABC transporter permease n=1 Tax=Paenibacillus paeoniae TaxID=2292705 RepID=A0A371PFD0_9BACL|nr:ABC transporter permease [Paenibacillus paeoniae]REK74659.1 ABC transporter permease [Paenibacillus paeoniae]